jgi:hypothetical protein
MHGPRGKSSIAFETGSVVVPGTSETMARLCPVNAFINDGLNKQGKSAKTSDYAHPEDRDIINEK